MTRPSVGPGKFVIEGMVTSLDGRGHSIFPNAEHAIRRSFSFVHMSIPATTVEDQYVFYI